MKVLANDGLSNSGQQALREADIEIIVTRVAQAQLADYINKNNIEVLLVRSSTQVRKDLLDACPNLKAIGRGGVGMDNIDIAYAREKGLEVFNTPAASSRSVAELVFAHLFGSIRFLHDSNRNMPLEGDSHFNDMKRGYSAGIELQGKTLGIVGLGNIGKEVARMALGLGMKVISNRNKKGDTSLVMKIPNNGELEVIIPNVDFQDLLAQSDFISFHVPAQTTPIIGKTEIEQLKDGVGLINTSRGGIIDEQALLDGFESGKVRFAGLDTFENEPTPSLRILMSEKISLSPHIGASTIEAQDKIGLELAKKTIAFANDGNTLKK